jgi:hypothetical protein
MVRDEEHCRRSRQWHVFQRLFLLCAVLAGVVASASAVWAHKPSDSYLTLNIGDHAIDGQWGIALRDLDHAIGLDTDDDGGITWGELEARQPAIDTYALARLDVDAGELPCRLQPTAHLVDDHSDGTYAVGVHRRLCRKDRLATGRLPVVLRCRCPTSGTASGQEQGRDCDHHFRS